MPPTDRPHPRDHPAFKPPPVRDLRPDERAFADHMADVMGGVDHLSQAQARAIVEELDRARDEVTDRLLKALPDGVDKWEVRHLQTLERQVADVMEDFYVRYGDSLRDGINGAWELGESRLQDALEAAGIDATGLGLRLPRAFRSQVEVAFRYSADLVQNMSAEGTKAVTAVVRAGVLGQRSPTEMLKDLRPLLSVPERGVETFGPIGYQCERLMRTEMLRTFNAADRTSQDYVVSKLGSKGANKIWLHSGRAAGSRPSHIALDGEMVPHGQKFNVGGYMVDGPHSPGLPAEHVIQCRCSSTLWYDQWGEPPRRPQPGSDAAKGRSPLHALNAEMRQGDPGFPGGGPGVPGGGGGAGGGTAKPPTKPTGPPPGQPDPPVVKGGGDLPDVPKKPKGAKAVKPPPKVKEPVITEPKVKKLPRDPDAPDLSKAGITRYDQDRLKRTEARLEGLQRDLKAARSEERKLSKGYKAYHQEYLDGKHTRKELDAFSARVSDARRRTRDLKGEVDKAVKRVDQLKLSLRHDDLMIDDALWVDDPKLSKAQEAFEEAEAAHKKAWADLQAAKAHRDDLMERGVSGSDLNAAIRRVDELEAVTWETGPKLSGTRDILEMAQQEAMERAAIADGVPKALADVRASITMQRRRLHRVHLEVGTLEDLEEASLAARQEWVDAKMALKRFEDKWQARTGGAAWREGEDAHAAFVARWGAGDDGAAAYYMARDDLFDAMDAAQRRVNEAREALTGATTSIGEARRKLLKLTSKHDGIMARGAMAVPEERIAAWEAEAEALREEAATLREGLDGSISNRRKLERKLKKLQEDAEDLDKLVAKDPVVKAIQAEIDEVQAEIDKLPKLDPFKAALDEDYAKAHSAARRELDDKLFELHRKRLKRIEKVADPDVLQRRITKVREEMARGHDDLTREVEEWQRLERRARGFEERAALGRHGEDPLGGRLQAAYEAGHKPPSEWTSIQEARDFWAAVEPTKTMEWADMPLEHVRAISEEWLDLRHEYPRAWARFGGMVKADPSKMDANDAVAWALRHRHTNQAGYKGHNGHIIAWRNPFHGPKGKMRLRGEQGKLLSGLGWSDDEVIGMLARDARSIFRHEFGHVVDYTTEEILEGLAGAGDYLPGLTGAVSGGWGGGPGGVRVEHLWTEARQKLLDEAGAISSYGETNKLEAWAEGFASRRWARTFTRPPGSVGTYKSRATSVMTGHARADTAADILEAHTSRYVDELWAWLQELERGEHTLSVEMGLDKGADALKRLNKLRARLGLDPIK